MAMNLIPHWRGKPLNVASLTLIGEGGEARVYKVAHDTLAKVFRMPDDTMYLSQPDPSAARIGAERRLKIAERKLREIPKGMPAERVVLPQDFLTDSKGKGTLGYTMPFLDGAFVLGKYADQDFAKGGVFNNDVLAVFRDLHGTVRKVHQAGVVLGDFNYLNVLVRGTEAWVIDIDSSQFGPYLCEMFTTQFVDPRLCEWDDVRKLILTKPHNQDSDWYAYATMMLECLTTAGPYFGVYRPKNLQDKIPTDKRPLKRITVFHPDVKVPRGAVPFGRLPDDLLHAFHQIFEKDQRGEFPFNVLEKIRWTQCSNCGVGHARATCPECAQAAPAAVKETVEIRGQVKANRFFTTRGGTILNADYQAGNLHYLYYENGEFKREDGRVVLKGQLDKNMRFRVSGAKTYIGMSGKLIEFDPSKAPPLVMYPVDGFGLLPVFDTNQHGVYWTTNGALQRDDSFSAFRIGDVISGQTLFWTGSKFGFGFYRAGQIVVAFVFDALTRGINDSVKIKPFRGQLVNAKCFLSDDLAWFFTVTQEQSQRINRCVVVDRKGAVLAEAEAVSGDGTWLGSSISGKAAHRNFLLCPTDDGVVRVEVQNGQITETRTFPDTEPFVKESSQLLIGKGGIYVVDANSIQLLQIG